MEQALPDTIDQQAQKNIPPVNTTANVMQHRFLSIGILLSFIICISLFGFAAYSNFFKKNTSSLSQTLLPSPSPTQKVPIDCGTERRISDREKKGYQQYPELQCMIDAAQNCTPALLTRILTVNNQGSTISTRSYSIKMDTNNTCVVQMKMGNVDHIYPTGIPEETQKQVRELLNQLEKTEGTCVYAKNADVVELFREMAKPESSTSSRDKDPMERKGNCTGSYFAFFITPTPTSTPIPTPTITPSPTPTPTPDIPPSTTLPIEGFQRMRVQTIFGIFTVYIIAAPVDRNKILVDGADGGNDCSGNVKEYLSCYRSVKEYAERSSAWAAINGAYFPAPNYYLDKNLKHYAWAGEATMVFKKTGAVMVNKSNMDHYIENVGNNITIIRIDPDAESAIYNHPTLVHADYVYTETNPSPKITRTFVATKGKTVYIGTVFAASLGDSAQVMRSLGMESALNLDAGGSTALWLNGKHILGPGRNVMNAIIFVKR